MSRSLDLGGMPIADLPTLEPTPKEAAKRPCPRCHEPRPFAECDPELGYWEWVCKACAHRYDSFVRDRRELRWEHPELVGDAAAQTMTARFRAAAAAPVYCYATLGNSSAVLDPVFHAVTLPDAELPLTLARCGTKARTYWQPLTARTPPLRVCPKCTRWMGQEGGVWTLKGA